MPEYEEHELITKAKIKELLEKQARGEISTTVNKHLPDYAYTNEWTNVSAVYPLEDLDVYDMTELIGKNLLITNAIDDRFDQVVVKNAKLGLLKQLITKKSRIYFIPVDFFVSDDN